MRTSFAALGLCLLIGSAVSGQEAVHLKWNLNPGNNFALEIEMETDQTLTVADMVFKQKSKQTNFFSYYPKGKKGQDWSVVQKLDRIKIDLDIGGNIIQVDTANKQTVKDRSGQFILEQVGTEWEMIVDKDYKITEIRRKGPLNQIIVPDPGNLETIIELLRPDNIQPIGGLFQVLPPKPVQKGDSWKNEATFKVGPLGNFQVTNRYVYDGVEGKLHRIKNEPTLTYLSPELDGGGLPFIIQAGKLTTSETNGTFLFDNDRGILHSGEVYLKLDGKLTVKISDQKSDITLTQTHKIIMRSAMK